MAILPSLIRCSSRFLYTPNVTTTVAPAARQTVGAEHPEPRDRRLSALLFAIVAVGAAFRLWRLGASRLNYDESFTAMAGRMPLGAMFTHLRLSDSHPPLDYLLRAPLARAGVSELFIRLPSAVCSIAALALFAWWMRGRGRTAVFATAMMALATFQIGHGREARMYAELQLIGVATAVVVDAWLRGPRRWHAALAGALTAIALLTHTSGLLLAPGLLLVPGRRTDRDAWSWRAAVAAGGLVWAALWGPAFRVQARGHHSSWIPHSTVSRAVNVVGSLVSPAGGIALLLVGAIVVGGVTITRGPDRSLARTWLCCFAVPVVLAIGLGRFSPVLLDRTLTLFAWGAPFAIAVAIDAVAPRAISAAGVAFAVVVALMLPGAVHTATAISGPTPALNKLTALARPGDVVAIEPLSKRVELDWTFGVRSRHGPTRPVRLNIARTPALKLTGAPSTGRVWLLDFYGTNAPLTDRPRCAPDWFHKPYRIECLRIGSTTVTGG
jgi:hypothetical protein